MSKGDVCFEDSLPRDVDEDGRGAEGRIVPEYLDVVCTLVLVLLLACLWRADSSKSVWFAAEMKMPTNNAY